MEIVQTVLRITGIAMADGIMGIITDMAVNLVEIKGYSNLYKLDCEGK